MRFGDVEKNFCRIETASGPDMRTMAIAPVPGGVEMAAMVSLSVMIA